MAVKIRLSRIGKKNAPVFRIIAIDERRKRDGEFLEDLGTYNPISGEVIRFKQDRIDYWVSQGAIPTNAVKKIQKSFKRKVV